MTSLKVAVSKSARKLMRDQNIKDVTFVLNECEVGGCCVGVVKDIEPIHQAPKDASGYRYVKTDDCHIFISRKLRIVGGLKLTTEGLFKKRLFLCGVTINL